MAKKTQKLSRAKSKKPTTKDLTSHRTWSGFLEVEAFEARSKRIVIPLNAILVRDGITIAALQRTQGTTTSYRIGSYRLVVVTGGHALEIIVEWSGTEPQRSYILYYVSGYVVGQSRKPRGMRQGN